ncbi:MAG: hypothetical protein IKT32_02190 [Clostridia bacterium]|nr:hypothetical protein [Clostridia bacterium]
MKQKIVFTQEQMVLFNYWWAKHDNLCFDDAIKQFKKEFDLQNKKI